MSDENKKWLSEYEAFLKADQVVVPRETTDNVFSVMEKLINPSPWIVFIKLISIHLAVGFLSLSVCHQFGINPFGTEMSLDKWFMAMWGHHTCMIVCGILFTSVSFLSAGYFLTIEEVRALRRTEFIQTLGLGAISLAIFAAFGAELALTFAGLWLLGALVGGFAATATIWKLKRVSV
jgi:hypothetical protein